MNLPNIDQLVTISQAAGCRADYVQGGGGNTSVKLDNEGMAVKASGFKLNQITETQGYVVVRYDKLREYFANVDPDSGIDYEKDCTTFTMANLVEVPGLPKLRPSVEAGFHAVLKKCVIHSHSVYANVLCCSANGQERAKQIFAGKPYRYVWVPYINPGFSLTLAIKEQVDRCIVETGIFPAVVMMENHGLVVTADEADECVKLHDEVNGVLIEGLGIKTSFPEVVIDKESEGLFHGATPFVREFFAKRNLEEGFFDRVALYPDQLVYLNSNMISDGTNAPKLAVDLKTGATTYRCGQGEAQTIEETLLAYLYVIDQVETCGLTIQNMSGAGIDYIQNWESEKYRKTVAAKS